MGPGILLWYGAHCARAYERRGYVVPDHSVCVSRRANLLAFGQAPDAARLAQQYLFGLALGVVPALWLQAIRNFMGVVNRPEPILRSHWPRSPQRPARIFAGLWQVRAAAA